MRALTIGEEIRVLKSLRPDDEIGAGSSRIVYRCSDEIVDFLKLDDTKDWVVKLAVGSGGFAQNQHEINTYMNEDEYYFAEIAVFGHFLSIMEKVDTDDYRDFADYIDYGDDLDEAVENYCDYEFEDADEDDKARLKEVARTIQYLAGIYGCTSDNGQLGITKDGRVVAYDYGFIADEGCSTQCSDALVETIYDDDAFREYISRLIGLLHETLHVNLALWVLHGKVSDIESEIVESY